MISIEFNIHKTKINYINKLIKRYDGRYKFNPIQITREKYKIGINFENDFNYQKFDRRLNIIEQNYF